MTEELKPADSGQDQAARFAEQARQPQSRLLADLLDFLLHNKKWWLTPIIVALLAVGVLIVLASSGAPFLYTIF